MTSRPQPQSSGPPVAQDFGKVGELTDIPEVKAYADRIGARAASLRSLVVEERAGSYARTVARLRFDDDGVVSGDASFLPTTAEAASISEAWGRYTWPAYKPVLHTGQGLPPAHPSSPWPGPDENSFSVCRDVKAEQVLCVEQRIERDDGSKAILIWTPWDDGRWRIAEPPEGLPLFGLELIQSAGRIFVHEGPKAAKAARSISPDSDHPWAGELNSVVENHPELVAHVAWLGGAERVNETDWTPLRNSGAEIIVISDNDRAGMEAVSAVSRAVRTKLSAVLFTDEWPRGFDLADKFPSDRTHTKMRDLMRDVTWATDRIPAARGRPMSYRLRPDFAKQWTYTVSPPFFFNVNEPGNARTEAEANKFCGPFSDAKDTTRLIEKQLSCQADTIAFLPGEKQGVIERNGQRVVNTWQPTKVEERDGSAWPIARLLVRLFPERSDRRHMIKWATTLIARPTVRIAHAPVLASETQGVGKTTLANLLGDLIGSHNVSRPRASDITDSNFNSHLARKRLCIVDEIYAANSRQTVNRLKPQITDPIVRVEEKYQVPYEIENWAHFVFTSNDLVPIFLEAEDRRFFVPRMNEAKPPREFFLRLYSWLQNDGPGIALRVAREWADKHGSLRSGAEAPASSAKDDLIENSVSDAMRSVRDLLTEIADAAKRGQRIAITFPDLQGWHRSEAKSQGWIPLSRNRLRVLVRKAGLFLRDRKSGPGGDKRVKLADGTKQVTVSNFDPDGEDDATSAIRAAITTVDAVSQGERPL